MAHLNRNNIGNFWSIPKKGTKYLAVAGHNQNHAIPLVVVMRDILKLIRNKKELQRLINEKQIMINHKEIRETNYPVGLFDIVNLPTAKKNYLANLSRKNKFIFEEISDKDAETKTCKIVGRKILAKGKAQLNLHDGRNILSDEKAKTGDSIVLNLKDNKILKILPLEKGQKGFVIKGKHTGSFGKIENILDRGGKKLAKILDQEDKINVWIKNIIIIE
jgi:small subunit ribosomal protein S4e